MSLFRHKAAKVISGTYPLTRSSSLLGSIVVRLQAASMAASTAIADTGDPPKRSNASTVGATTYCTLHLMTTLNAPRAVSRSILTYFGQMFAFYIRHPVKLFRPSLDYTVGRFFVLTLMCSSLQRHLIRRYGLAPPRSTNPSHRW